MKKTRITLSLILLGLIPVFSVLADVLPSSDKIIIEGQRYTGNDVDTFRLDIHHNKGLEGVSLDRVDTSLYVLSENGKFRFEISAEKSPVYVSLSTSSQQAKHHNHWSYKKLLHNTPLLPGDSLLMAFSSDEVYFLGDDRARRRLELLKRIQIEGSRISYGMSPFGLVVNNVEVTKLQFSRIDSIYHSQMRVLENAKDSISGFEYKLIKMGIAAQRLSSFHRPMSIGRLGIVDPHIHAFEMKYYEDHLKGRSIDPDLLDIAHYSAIYVSNIYQSIVVENIYEKILAGNPNFNRWEAARSYLPIITERYKGILRDRLLLLWNQHLLRRGNLLEEDIKQALAHVKEAEVRHQLLGILANMGKGSPVSDHTFVDPKGNEVRLSDFKGKVLLLDFWFTGCSGCVEIAEKLRDVEAAFPNRDKIEFLSISIDKDLDTWRGSIQPEGRAYRKTDIYYTHYTTDKTVYLNTGGSGSENDFIRKYVAGNLYPTLIVVDAQQRIYSAAPPKPYTAESTKEMIQFLKKAIKNQ